MKIACKQYFLAWHALDQTRGFDSVFACRGRLPFRQDVFARNPFHDEEVGDARPSIAANHNLAETAALPGEPCIASTPVRREGNETFVVPRCAKQNKHVPFRLFDRARVSVCPPIVDRSRHRQECNQSDGCEHAIEPSACRAHRVHAPTSLGCSLSAMWCRLTIGYERFEYIAQFCRHSIPTSAPVRRDCLCVPACVEHRCECLSKRGGVPGWHEASTRVVHNLGNAADIRGNDRTATSKGLQDSVRAPFHVTRQGDQIRCRHPDGDIVGGTTRQGMNVAGSVAGLNRRFDERPVRPLANQIYMQFWTLSTHRNRCRNRS